MNWLAGGAAFATAVLSIFIGEYGYAVILFVFAACFFWLEMNP